MNHLVSSGSSHYRDNLKTGSKVYIVININIDQCLKMLSWSCFLPCCQALDLITKYVSLLSFPDLLLTGSVQFSNNWIFFWSLFTSTQLMCVQKLNFTAQRNRGWRDGREKQKKESDKTGEQKNYLKKSVNSPSPSLISMQTGSAPFSWGC